MYIVQFCFWPACNWLSGGQQDQRDNVAEISSCERCILSYNDDLVMSASSAAVQLWWENPKWKAKQTCRWDIRDTAAAKG